MQRSLGTGRPLAFVGAFRAVSPSLANRRVTLRCVQAGAAKRRRKYFFVRFCSVASRSEAAIVCVARFHFDSALNRVAESGWSRSRKKI